MKKNGASSFFGLLGFVCDIIGVVVVVVIFVCYSQSRLGLVRASEELPVVYISHIQAHLTY